VGRWIRAKIQDTNYAPYPNFSILNKDYLDVCYPIASITYARHDGRSLDYYIYNNEQAQKRIREWKTWAEWWEMIWRTKDWYPTYEYSSAIGGHYYYIELDDGDILSVWWYYTWDIRIHRIESPTLAH
jgi:hypothetical protein